MSANIKLTFATEGGKDYTLSISDCRYPMESSKVKTGAKDIVDSGALATPYGKPVSVKKAVVYIPETKIIDVK